MNIYEIDISKSKLLAMKKSERKFFMNFAHFHNEVNILLRCITSTGNFKPSNDIEKHGITVQHLFFLRMLASKLYECHRMFESTFYKSTLAKELEDKLSNKAKKIQKELNRYFSQKNNLYVLRNKFGFHYDPGKLEEGLNCLAKEEEEKCLKMLLADNRGNSLYLFSDVAMFSAIRDSVVSNGKDSFNLSSLEKEIYRVATLFQDFGYECLKIIAETFLMQDRKEHDISDPPLYDDIKLPCFMIGEPIKKREVKGKIIIKV